MIKQFLILFLALFSVSVIAEEEFEDFNFELEFGIKKKSTLNDFPLQEIGSDELSDAAIGGALGSASTTLSGEQGKPAYEDQNDIDDKRKKEELKVGSDRLSAEDFLRNSLIPQLPQLPRQVFNEDVNRTMMNNYNTVERP